MVLLSDKVMAQAELASSNPLHDALSSAPIALAMFVALLTFSEFMTTQLCDPHKGKGECTQFAAYISFLCICIACGICYGLGGCRHVLPTTAESAAAK